jgi:hypothetical protein
MPILLHTSAVVTRAARGFSALLVCTLWPLVAILVHADTVSDWNQTAIEVMKVASVGGNPWSRHLAAENARLFALLNMGVANTFINDWDAKFTYHFWRPVTALRNGDMDSNDATERDPSWTSLNATPMHPEYPSQAAIVAGVAVSILESVFGPQPAIPITATDLMDPKLTRPFKSIAQMAEEHKHVRIWGGIHFRNSLDVGYDMGKKSAAYLVDNSLKPAR